MKKVKVKIEDGKVIEGMWNEKYYSTEEKDKVRIYVDNKKIICKKEDIQLMDFFGKEWKDEFDNVWAYRYTSDGKKIKELIKKGDKEYIYGKEWEANGIIYRYKYYPNGDKETEVVKIKEKEIKDTYGNIFVRELENGKVIKKLKEGKNVISKKVFYDEKTNKWLAEKKIGIDFISLKQLLEYEDFISWEVQSRGGRWICETITEEASEEEIKKELARLEKEAYTEYYNIIREKLKNYIQKNMETWEGQITLQNEKMFINNKNSIIYGGGDWFVVEGEYVYYIQNNGADGDDWSINNVITSGAGAVGQRTKLNTKIKKMIEKLKELEKIIGGD